MVFLTTRTGASPTMNPTLRAIDAASQQQETINSMLWMVLHSIDAFTARSLCRV